MVDQAAHLYLKNVLIWKKKTSKSEKNNLGGQFTECFKNDPRVTNVML